MRLALFGNLPFALRQLSTQAFILFFQAPLGVLAPSSLGSQHATHGTLI